MKHGMAKLSAHDVEAIKQGRAGGVSVTELAAQFGVSTTHIRRIVTGKSWRE